MYRAPGEETSATAIAGKKKKKVFWVTSAMAKNMADKADRGRDPSYLASREAYMVATARELVIYLLFLLIVTFAILGMIDPHMYYMTAAIRGQLKDTEFRTEFGRMKFDNIRCVGDIWSYLDDNLCKHIYTEDVYGEKSKGDVDKGVLYVNKLIGVPRIRQVTVKNNSCTTHPRFRRAFLVCYAGYNAYTRSEYALVGGEGDAESAFTYNEPEGLMSTSHSGVVAYYDGGGFVLELMRDAQASLALLKTLKSGMWIRRESRAVFVDFTLYNTNVNLFCHVKLVFELPPTGGVLPSAYFHTMKLIRYYHIIDHVVLGCEVIFLGFLLYYIAEALREVCFLKLAYLKCFWSYMDVAIIITAILYFVYILHQHMAMTHLLELLEKSIEEFNSFEMHTEDEMAHRTISAVCLFLVTVKLFKYMNFNNSMVQLSTTLRQCSRDVIGFLIMFLLIFISFAVLGYLVFGTQVTDFAGFGVSMFTLLRTILGDFDYTEIEKAHKVLAPIYFIMFIFLVFFVLLNMFLAIINDTYSDVKTEMSIAPDRMAMTDFWRRGAYNVLTDCGCGACTPRALIKKSDDNATAEEIRKILKKCGFSDLDIDMFFAKYNIDPAAEVRVRDVAKLIESIRQPMDDSQAPTGPKDEKKKPKTTPSGVPPVIPMDEFVAQQERLDKVENIMATISEKLELLLKRLNAMENVKKH